MILKPTAGAEFFGSSLPAGWTGTPWSGAGSVTVGGGRVVIDDARLVNDPVYGPGRSLEFVDTFTATPFQHAGFATDFNAAPWAIFSTFGSGTELYARTDNAAGNSTNTNLGSSWLGSPHRYRIDWLPGSVVFSIEVTQVASHTVSFVDVMHPAASDFGGGPTLTLDWMRMSPYAASGTFQSRIFDAGSTVPWGAFSWTAQTPRGEDTGSCPSPPGVVVVPRWGRAANAPGRLEGPSA